ncbi:hypothetical protein [Sphingobacterium yanglingense]|uniref:Lipocalin-like protein n=1 Tax=Sphingobacterium yanglingense TaxID=1437280 RepID=A0A4R6W4U7_9SPHI|nr:hypothetical protein [Sphingobacterium yanglingense]TDQ73727.1 hypothetical protein CLV99_4164 [Sphingobacterium yanglingense]
MKTRILCTLLIMGAVMIGKAQEKTEDIVGKWTVTKLVQQIPEGKDNPTVRTDSYKTGENVWQILKNGKASNKQKDRKSVKGYYVYVEDGKLYLTHKDAAANELYLLQLKDRQLLMYDVLAHDFDDANGYKSIHYLVKLKE